LHGIVHDGSNSLQKNLAASRYGTRTSFSYEYMVKVPSAEGRACDRESSPAKDRRTTTVPRHQPRPWVTENNFLALDRTDYLNGKFTDYTEVQTDKIIDKLTRASFLYEFLVCLSSALVITIIVKPL